MKFLLLPLMLLAATHVNAQISAIDHRNREVQLLAHAKRIVALAPHIVENTFSAGAGDRLVGVASYSNFPDGAKSIDVVGNFQSWSLEKIISVRPDLVLMWGSGNGTGTLATLEKLGIPIFVSDPRTLQDIPDTIRAIGILAGTQSVSESEALRMETEIAHLHSQYHGKMPLSVFYQVWDNPLQTINGEHIISDVMELCGGYNAFADTPSLAPKIGLESILQRNPNAIVASGMGATRPDWLNNWQRYPSLSSVRNNGLFFIHPDHIQRPTARILLGAKTMCEQLDTLRHSQTANHGIRSDSSS